MKFVWTSQYVDMNGRLIIEEVEWWFIEKNLFIDIPMDVLAGYTPTHTCTPCGTQTAAAPPTNSRSPATASKMSTTGGLLNDPIR